MATTLYSSLNDGDTLPFDPFSDVLDFDLTNISAASVLLTQSGSDLVITADGKTITLLGVSLAQLSFTNITFADGSVLRVGDSFATVIDDDAANYLPGTAGQDQLIGLGGDDQLFPGSGADRMEGNSGNDLYFLDDAGDEVVEMVDEGVDHVYSNVNNYVLPSNVENLTLTLAGAGVIGFGNELENYLVGNTANNQLYGLSGNDLIDGWTGADTLIGGTGDDSYVVNSADDVVVELANEGTDTVRASISYVLGQNLENLTLTFIFGSVGSASINGTGNELDNIITGNEGDNVLDGGVGADTMSGSYGFDTYVVDDVGDTVIEVNDGRVNTVISSISFALPDNVHGLILTGTADLEGIGNTLNNRLTGNSGENYLKGDYGDDFLQGAVGNDILLGDLGRDTAIFSGNSGGYIVSSTLNSTIDVTDVNDTDGDDGIDTLTSFEVLRFAGGDFTLATEHQVSPTATGHQQNAVVAALTGGGYVVTWKSSEADVNVSAQRFSADGSAEGSEFRVNSTTTNEQTSPSIASLSDGGFVVVWMSALQPGVFFRVYAQRYSSDGTPVGGETQVNTVSTAVQSSSPSVAGLADGGYVVAWQTHLGPAGPGVYAQLYDANGIALGSETHVNTTNPAGNPFPPTITALSDGTYVIVWAYEGVGMYAQRYGASGTPIGSEVMLNNVGAAPNVAALADGTYVVSWASFLNGATDIIVQRYDASGASLGSPVTLNTSVDVINQDMAISELADGGLVVTWRAFNVLDHVIFAQRIDSEGNIVGGETQINTTTFFNFHPSVEGLSDGGYVIAWENFDQGTGAWRVSAQRFDSEGNRLVDVLEIRGTMVDDVIRAGDGVQALVGLQGNDTLEGGAGEDKLVGGIGNDTYIVNDENDRTIEGANQGTDLVQSYVDWTLASSTESLTLLGSMNLNGTGNAVDNLLTGNSGNNVLIGAEGNDTLDGGAGVDTMVGGTGNDTYVLDVAGDVVTELANEGRDLIRTGMTYVLGANLEDLTLTGAANINGTGNTLDNALTGNSGSNVLDTDGGNDTLDGGLGADTLTGGSGDDTYVVDNAGDVVTETPNKGTDLVQSTISYVLPTNVEHLTLTGSGDINGTGNSSNNTLTGNSGSNSLNGGTGHDNLAGGEGQDTLTGGTGADTMTGGAGDDTYVVDSIGDAVTEAADEGTDTVQSSISYSLGANVENLMLIGTANLDGTGNALPNVITGNAGKNVLDGAGGADALEGGAGNDILVWDSLDYSIDGQDGNDTLRVDGGGTVLDLTGIDNGVISNVEEIDITGSGNNTLVLALSDVLDISSTTDTLKIEGNAGDVVNAGSGWTSHGISAGYNLYTQELATLLVDRDVTQNVG